MSCASEYWMLIICPEKGAYILILWMIFHPFWMDSICVLFCLTALSNFWTTILSTHINHKITKRYNNFRINPIPMWSSVVCTNYSVICYPCAFTCKSFVHFILAVGSMEPGSQQAVTFVNLARQDQKVQHVSICWKSLRSYCWTWVDKKK